MRRKWSEARAKSFYKLIQNGGICVYCGIRATTVDHFAPLSVVAAVMGLLETTGKFLVPSCGECNRIASDKIFKTVAAKRRYIHQRLRDKYRKELSMPDWTEDELEELSYNLRRVGLSGLATRQWLKERLQWRNTKNPAYVNIAAIRLNLLARGENTAISVAKERHGTSADSKFSPHFERRKIRRHRGRKPMQ